jgi:hypothetical protein
MNGIAIDWQSVTGNARGTIFRLPDDVLLRLPAGGQGGS